jgi:hypothetical protein
VIRSWFGVSLLVVGVGAWVLTFMYPLAVTGTLTAFVFLEFLIMIAIPWCVRTVRASLRARRAARDFPRAEIYN